MIPNQIRVIVEARGSIKDLKSLRAQLEGFNPNFRGAIDFSEFCLNEVIPMPLKVLKKGSQLLLEQHRLDLWGTATDALSVSRTLEPHEIRYSFISMDAPPHKVLETLIRAHKGLLFKITHKDLLEGVTGTITGHKGMLHKDVKYLYKEVSR